MNRKLSKTTGTTATWLGIISLIGSILLLALSFPIANNGWWGLRLGFLIVLIIIGVGLLALSTAQIMLGRKLAANPDNPKKLLIALAIIGFFANMIIFVMALATLNSQAIQEIESEELDKLKQYKAAGLIDEATYREKVAQLLKN